MFVLSLPSAHFNQTQFTTNPFGSKFNSNILSVMTITSVPRQQQDGRHTSNGGLRRTHSGFRTDFTRASENRRRHRNSAERNIRQSLSLPSVWALSQSCETQRCWGSPALSAAVLAASHLHFRCIIGTLDNFKFSAPPLGSGVGKVTLQDCGGKSKSCCQRRG